MKIMRVLKNKEGDYKMSESRAAIHAKGKVYVDKLFAAGTAAKQAIVKYDKENVIDASVGAITDDEWDKIKDLILEEAKNSAKTITLVIDIAYIDYTKNPTGARVFMKKFGWLPANVIVAFAFSMSKGFTVYGQRTGALIGVSPSQDIIEEFKNVNLVTSRARWSNVNRGCMSLLANIYKDDTSLKKVNAEREKCIDLIAERAEIFMKEASERGLNVLPI